ncbi:MAG TPA: hypothetical protein EYP51_05195 [Thiotrichales bacterium]|nr:hypothetical protein [Thiotrichales bacterium]
MNLSKYKNLREHYTVGPDNRVRFTQLGKKEMAPLFAMAGININSVKTISELKQAYKAAGPYVGQHHLNIAQKGKPSRERDALIAVTKGNYEEADRIIGQLQQKKTLRIV